MSFRCIGPRWISSEWGESPRRTWPSGWRKVHPRWLAGSCWEFRSMGFAGKWMGLDFSQMWSVEIFEIEMCWDGRLTGSDRLTLWPLNTFDYLIIFDHIWSSSSLFDNHHHLWLLLDTSSSFHHHFCNLVLVLGRDSGFFHPDFQAFRSLAPAVQGDRRRRPDGAVVCSRRPCVNRQIIYRWSMTGGYTILY